MISYPTLLLALAGLGAVLAVLTLVVQVRAEQAEERQRAAGREALLQRLAVIPDPVQKAELLELLDGFFPDPVLWLETPNAGFRERPQRLLEAGRAAVVIEALRGVKYDTFS